MTSKIIKLFQEMSDLTAPECANSCKIPHSCCSPEYCDMAEENAQGYGVTLEVQNKPIMGRPVLKYMGPNGCVVAPHLRPLCTLHTCAISGFGFKPKDPEWTTKYFNLREKIEEEFYEQLTNLQDKQVI